MNPSKPRHPWCHLARLATLLIDQAPAEKRTRAEELMEQIVEVMQDNTDIAHRTGLHEGAEDQRQEDAALLAQHEAEIAKLRSRLALLALGEAEHEAATILH